MRPRTQSILFLLAAFAIAGVELVLDARRFAYAYLAAFCLAVSAGLGALAFIMIANTARARWAVALRRPLEAVALTLTLAPLFFLPICFILPVLYPWARPLTQIDGELRSIIEHQRIWMNPPLFVVRSYLYLGSWAALAILLRRASVLNDLAPSELWIARQRTWSAAGLPIIALTIAFASFDWLVPLNPGWYSDIFGVYLFAGSFACAMGVTAVAAIATRKADLLPSSIGPDVFHALGRVMLVSVIFWAYIAFSQLLLIWIADKPHESSFYFVRVRQGWQYASGVLLAVHFVVPFLLLLSRALKRAPAKLAMVGFWLILAHGLDVYWLVLPAAGRGMSWLDVGILAAVPAIFTSFGIRRFLAARPLPAHDPALVEALQYESP